MTASITTIHCREFHELAMDYRAASEVCMLNSPEEAYKRLVSYVDTEISQRVSAIRLPEAPLQQPTSDQIQQHPAFGIFLCALGALAIWNMDEARGIAQRMRDALDIHTQPVGEQNG